MSISEDYHFIAIAQSERKLSNEELVRHHLEGISKFSKIIFLKKGAKRQQFQTILIVFESLSGLNRLLSHRVIEAPTFTLNTARIDNSTAQYIEKQSRTKLYVGNISTETTNLELWNHFKDYGRLAYSYVITDRKTNKSKGFGFVIFEEREAMEKALSDDSRKLNGRLLKLKPFLNKSQIKRAKKSHVQESYASSSSLNIFNFPQNQTPAQNNNIEKQPFKHPGQKKQNNFEKQIIPQQFSQNVWNSHFAPDEYMTLSLQNHQQNLPSFKKSFMENRPCQENHRRVPIVNTNQQSSSEEHKELSRKKSSNDSRKNSSSNENCQPLQFRLQAEVFNSKLNLYHGPTNVCFNRKQWNSPSIQQQNAYFDYGPYINTQYPSVPIES